MKIKLIISFFLAFSICSVGRSSAVPFHLTGSINDPYIKFGSEFLLSFNWTKDSIENLKISIDDVQLANTKCFFSLHDYLDNADIIYIVASGEFNNLLNVFHFQFTDDTKRLVPNFNNGDLSIINASIADILWIAVSGSQFADYYECYGIVTFAGAEPVLPVPEPSSLLLVFIGFIMILLTRHRYYRATDDS